ncbi:hypothetical protein [Paenibacillus humicus]|uniref:hypothetical protein n=1 Tax=Paenibacillus humicus TaxID=412861 RepID=UPI000FD932A2|nr:hypothetical protein [Paenibacillus humicus]
MVTYGFIAAISIGASIVESRCRSGGNTAGALAAKRFGRAFTLATGAAIAYELLMAMIALIP